MIECDYKVMAVSVAYNEKAWMEVLWMKMINMVLTIIIFSGKRYSCECHITSWEWETMISDQRKQRVAPIP